MKPEKKHGNTWKGGKHLSHGYVRVLMPEHLRANPNGRLIESNVGLKRAQNTQKLNPGSQIKTSGNAGKGGKNEYYNQDRKNYRPG